MEVLGDFKTSVMKALDEIDPEWGDYPGLIVCGGHKIKDAEKMIQAITHARVSGLPFLGICMGHQLAAIEYARNVLGIEDATSEEFGSGTFVVKKRDAFKVGHQGDGSYWSNYDVAIETKHPKHFFTTPSHPEYESAPWKPHPLLVAFLDYARKVNG